MNTNQKRIEHLITLKGVMRNLTSSIGFFVGAIMGFIYGFDHCNNGNSYSSSTIKIMLLIIIGLILLISYRSHKIENCLLINKNILMK